MLVPDESPLCSHENLENSQEGLKEIIVVLPHGCPIFNIHLAIIIKLDFSCIEAHSYQCKNVHKEWEKNDIGTNYRNGIGYGVNEHPQIANLEQLEYPENSKSSEDQDETSLCRSSGVLEVNLEDAAHHNKKIKDIESFTHEWD